MAEYKSIKRPYKDGKVVVTGGNGTNGLYTTKYLMQQPGVNEIVPVVRTEDKKAFVESKIREWREQYFTHDYVKPEVAVVDPKNDIAPQEEEKIAYAEAWVNWKGLSLAAFEENSDDDLAERADREGVQVRDLLLEKNLGITLDDAQLAFDYAPNAVYVVGINPVDVMTRSIQRFRDEKNDVFDNQSKTNRSVVSPSTKMEYYRLTKLLSSYLEEEQEHELNLSRASGMAIGEHGDNVVFYGVSLGGIPAQDYLSYLKQSPQEGFKELDTIYDRVTDEAGVLRDLTGETPYLGPSKVSADLVKRMVSSGGSVNMGISTYHASYGDWEDIAMSVPTSVGKDHLEPVPFQFIKDSLTGDEIETLNDAVKHLSKLNRRADEMYEEWKQDQFGMRE